MIPQAPSSAPQGGDAVSSLSEVRKLRNVLQGVDFFTRLRLEELEVLLEHLKKRTVPRGTLVIQQGEKNADAFYMVASGRCTVWKKKGSTMDKVADLGPERYFGERALITNEPRAATVRAETTTELYVLYKDDFNAILMKNPGIAQELKFHIAQYKR
jgi:CRP-like cAMP-binding protein